MYNLLTLSLNNHKSLPLMFLTIKLYVQIVLFASTFNPSEMTILKTPIYSHLSNLSESSLTYKLKNQSLIQIVTISPSMLLPFYHPIEYSLNLSCCICTSNHNEIESLFGYV